MNYLIDIQDLVTKNNWIMNEQNIIQIPDTKKYLSIVPEYVFKHRDKNDKIVISKTPVGIKLNCALQVGDEYVDYVEFYSGGDFLNYYNNQIEHIII